MCCGFVEVNVESSSQFSCEDVVLEDLWISRSFHRLFVVKQPCVGNTAAHPMHGFIDLKKKDFFKCWSKPQYGWYLVSLCEFSLNQRPEFK